MGKIGISFTKKIARKRTVGSLQFKCIYASQVHKLPGEKALFYAFSISITPIEFSTQYKILFHSQQADTHNFLSNHCPILLTAFQFNFAYFLFEICFCLSLSFKKYPHSVNNGTKNPFATSK